MMIPQLKIFKDQSPAGIEDKFNAWMRYRRTVIVQHVKDDNCGISDEKDSTSLSDARNLPPPTTHLQYDSSLQAFIFTVVYLMYPYESNDVK